MLITSFIILIIGVILIWILYTFCEKSDAKQAEEAEAERLRQEEEKLQQEEERKEQFAKYKASLVQEIENLDCTVPELLKTFFFDYTITILQKLETERVEYKWFSEDDLKLYTFTVGRNSSWQFESMMRMTLHKTWWICPIDELKERLLSKVELLTDITASFKQLVIQEFVNTTYPALKLRIESWANNYSRTAENAFYDFRQAHPEAYQIARVVSAIDDQTATLTSSIRTSAQDIVSKMKGQISKVEKEVSNVERKLAGIESNQQTTSMLAGLAMVNSLNR